MSVIQERGSTHVYKVNRISKDEIENMVSLCVYDQPAFCSAACPLKLDAKAMLAAAADGDFKKALGLYEKAVIFPPPGAAPHARRSASFPSLARA